MTDPFSAGGFDPRMFEQVPLFRELAKVMAWSGGPVNWDLARQTAEAIAASDAPPVSDRDVAEFSEAVTVAELWLDQATGLAAVEGPVQVLTPAEWVRLAASSGGLGLYVEPVAQGMGAALSGGLPEQLQGLGAGQPGLEGAIGQAMNAMGAMLYGMQAGTIAGNLAGQLLGCYDLGVPTLDPRVVGIVGDSAQRFAGDYGVEPTELRYWLALREAAHRRMFAGHPWLRQQVADLVRRFAADADFDPTSMMDAMGLAGLDPGDPEAIQAALQRPDAFRIQPTTAQQRTLDELQSLVSFVEAYSDTVVRGASSERLPALPRIEEALRRRRAEKGPGERFLQQLIGLDLEPAHVRTAQDFCDAVVAARGQEGLDRVWQRPEHLPGPHELAEPSRWLLRMAAAELGTGDET